MIGRRLFTLQLTICASPAYLAQHGVLKSLAALSTHRCSVFRNPGTGRVLPRYVRDDNELIEHHVVPALTVNDEALETEAVLAGHVIGLLTSVVAAPHIRSGRLVPILLDYLADKSGVFIYHGSRTSLPTRVRAFIDMAVNLLTDKSACVLSADELFEFNSDQRQPDNLLCALNNFQAAPKFCTCEILKSSVSMTVLVSLYPDRYFQIRCLHHDLFDKNMAGETLTWCAFQTFIAQ